MWELNYNYQHLFQLKLISLTLNAYKKWTIKTLPLVTNPT